MAITDDQGFCVSALTHIHALLATNGAKRKGSQAPFSTNTGQHYG